MQEGIGGVGGVGYYTWVFLGVFGLLKSENGGYVNIVKGET